MERIKVQFESGLVVWQVSEDGIVTHYEDDAGTVLFEQPPEGGCEVLDA